MALYLMKQVKDCILAVLDSTVDEKGVVHHQVLESDRNGRAPDDGKKDGKSVLTPDDESIDLGTCVDLTFDLTVTHKFQVYTINKYLCQC